MHGIASLTWIVVALMLCCGSTGRAAAVFSHVDACGIVSKSILVSPSDMHAVGIEKVARDFAQKVLASHKTGVLRMATTVSDLNRIMHKSDLGPSNPCLGDLNDLVKCVERLTRQPGLQGPVARVWAVGDAAVVEYVVEQKLHFKMLTGHEDPTQLVAGGVRFRLLSVSISQLNAEVADPKACVVSFYLQSQTVSFSSTVTLTRRLTSTTTAGSVTVYVRQDPWYLNDARFPEILPFERDLPTPSVASFVLKPELSCGVTRGQWRCSGKGFFP